jgi:hypothetical protein
MSLNKIEIITLKLSAAFHALDELTGMENRMIFLGRFEREYKRFFGFFEEHSKEISANIWEKSPGMFNLYSLEFDSLLRSKIASEDEEKIHVFLMYCYCVSAMRDIEVMRKEIELRGAPVAKVFIEPLYKRLGEILKGKYLRGKPFLNVHRETVNRIDKLYEI